MLLTYYQWSTILLLALALMARAPHMLWKQREGNLMRMLVPEGIERKHYDTEEGAKVFSHSIFDL